MWVIRFPDDSIRLFQHNANAVAFVERHVAGGLDTTPEELGEHGWRWVYPADNPEGEHMYFVNLKRPALSIELVCFGITDASWDPPQG